MARRCMEFDPVSRTWTARAMTEREEAQRNIDEAKHRSAASRPKQLTVEDRLAAIEAALGVKSQPDGEQ